MSSSKSPAAWRSDRDRPKACGTDRSRLGRAEGDPRDHAVFAQQRRRYVARGAHLQDLWRRGRPAHLGKSYRLARDIRGIGFRTADQIAAKLGIEKTAPVRVRAGIAFALTEAMDEGHCGLPAETLVPATAKLLEVPAELVEEALHLELGTGTVIADDLDGRRCVFLAGLYRAEQEIAEKLATLAVGKPPWPPIDADKAIPWVERRPKLALASGQREAIRVALASKILVITGGPGVGKTTLVNSLLAVAGAKAVAIALCAPTGRAAKHLSESTGLEAKTIHRLLETDPRTGSFRRKEDAPLDCDLLVVDETSMVDVPLMRALLRALPEQAALLLVGDVDQLPSVGPGQVLADIIASGAVPVECSAR